MICGETLLPPPEPVSRCWQCGERGPQMIVNIVNTWTTKGVTNCTLHLSCGHKISTTDTDGHADTIAFDILAGKRKP